MRFVLSQTSGSCVVLRYIDIGCMTLDNLLFEGTMKGSTRVCLPTLASVEMAKRWNRLFDTRTLPFRSLWSCSSTYCEISFSWVRAHTLCKSNDILEEDALVLGREMPRSRALCIICNTGGAMVTGKNKRKCGVRCLPQANSALSHYHARTTFQSTFRTA